MNRLCWTFYDPRSSSSRYTDNYLHEAALADNPPSGTVYDPENDGIRLESLGVHEHWNNSTDKQYTRNLGTGEGIELTKIINSTSTGIESSNVDIPSTFTLYENYPNPFNPTTTISYSIPKQSFITIKIFDALGREVAALVNEEKPAGNYKINLMPPGCLAVYIIII